MLALARRRRRDVSQKLILGGASMGSASALYAARATLWTTRSPVRIPSAPPPRSMDSSSSSYPRSTTPVAGGARRSSPPRARIRRATASRKKIRPIFRGTEREDEPPIAMGVRPDSFEHVMRASAVSDLPPAEDMSSRAPSHPPTLALCWDCGDAEHPASSAARLAELVPSAEVRVARSLEETREWPRVIREFVGGL